NGIVLEQTLTIVLQPDAIDSHSAFSSIRKLQPGWSMNSLFRRTIDGKCALAKSCNVDGGDLVGVDVWEADGGVTVGEGSVTVGAAVRETIGAAVGGGSG
ncbi:hypothetical protein Tco_1562057, partial [Tanacetum coccineum]